jgi:hypothetical protein
MKGGLLRNIPPSDPDMTLPDGMGNFTLTAHVRNGAAHTVEPRADLAADQPAAASASHTHFHNNPLHIEGHDFGTVNIRLPDVEIVVRDHPKQFRSQKRQRAEVVRVGSTAVQAATSSAVEPALWLCVVPLPENLALLSQVMTCKFGRPFDLTDVWQPSLQSIAFLLEAGVSFTLLQQYPGDIVVLKPGVAHLVLTPVGACKISRNWTDPQGLMAAVHVCSRGEQGERGAWFKDLGDKFMLCLARLLVAELPAPSLPCFRQQLESETFKIRFHVLLRHLRAIPDEAERWRATAMFNDLLRWMALDGKPVAFLDSSGSVQSVPSSPEKSLSYAAPSAISPSSSEAATEASTISPLSSSGNGSTPAFGVGHSVELPPKIKPQLQKEPHAGQITTPVRRELFPPQRTALPSTRIERTSSSPSPGAEESSSQACVKQRHPSDSSAAKSSDERPSKRLCQRDVVDTPCPTTSAPPGPLDADEAQGMIDVNGSQSKSFLSLASNAEIPAKPDAVHTLLTSNLPFEGASANGATVSRGSLESVPQETPSASTVANTVPTSLVCGSVASASCNDIDALIAELRSALQQHGTTQDRSLLETSSARYATLDHCVQQQCQCVSWILLSIRQLSIALLAGKDVVPTASLVVRSLQVLASVLTTTPTCIEFLVTTSFAVGSGAAQAHAHSFLNFLLRLLESQLHPVADSPRHPSFVQALLQVLERIGTCLRGAEALRHATVSRGDASVTTVPSLLCRVITQHSCSAERSSAVVKKEVSTAFAVLLYCGAAHIDSWWAELFPASVSPEFASSMPFRVCAATAAFKHADFASADSRTSFVETSVLVAQKLLQHPTPSIRNVAVGRASVGAILQLLDFPARRIATDGRCGTIVSTIIRAVSAATSALLAEDRRLDLDAPSIAVHTFAILHVLLHHPNRSALCLPAMQLVNTLRANPSRGVVLDEPQQQKSWAEKHIVDVMEEHSTAAAQSSMCTAGSSATASSSSNFSDCACPNLAVMSGIASTNTRLTHFSPNRTCRSHCVRQDWTTSVMCMGQAHSLDVGSSGPP